LIFDEVMTGFRLGRGGVQELMGVKADIVTFGKIVGGGMPVGAVAGSAGIMSHLAPVGKVYQAGTLSGNPVAMIAGYTTLSILNKQPELYTQLETITSYLAEELRKLGRENEVPVTVNQIGSMISLHFTNKPVNNFADAAVADNELFKEYFHFMLQQGIYLPPSPFETWFISIAIGEGEVNRILSATEVFFKSL
jgi:glutamate-1-semialdehyde 2,1-aminomutase